METTVAKKTKRTKKSLFNGLLVKLFVIAASIGCAAIIVTANNERSEKEAELQTIQAKIDSYEAQNAELQRVLEGDDMSEYMEKVAIEEYGYAYSDERRFYDTSRD